MFTPRLTRPEKGNKFYITKSSGGYSSAIKGKPTDSDCDVLANCVGYAAGRFHEIANRPQMDLFDPVNAENIFENAKQHGLKTGKTPALGALIVWQKGATLGSGDGAGHVAVVEQILGGGRIVTSESGYNAKNPFWTAHYDSPYAYKTGYKLLGCVYQPEAQTQRAMRKGDKGEDVRNLQEALVCRGYLRRSEIDGDFGAITLGAVLAFQFENDLEVDGIAGPKTQAALYF
jgi:surface antigen